LFLEDFVIDKSTLLKEPIYYEGTTQTHMAIPLTEPPVWGKAPSQIYYDLSRKIKNVPLGWSAPECLESLKWNKKSDVWSWGILMWELCSFGKTPKRCKTIKAQVEMLKNGTRLSIPGDLCSDDVWKLISKCWEFNKNKRPDFIQIKEELNTLLSTTK